MDFSVFAVTGIDLDIGDDADWADVLLLSFQKRMCMILPADWTAYWDSCNFAPATAHLRFLLWLAAYMLRDVLCMRCLMLTRRGVGSMCDHPDIGAASMHQCLSVMASS
jgi:hypothetical protein